MAVFFNGRLLVSPTTASVVNDDAMRNANLTVGNVVAVLGRSAGGKPKTALRFGSPQEARDALVSGELLTAVMAAFDPSSETNGPSQVVAIRVNPATQSTLALKNASAADVITLTSKGYGASESLVRVKVEAGTLKGRRITTQRGLDYFTEDNIARDAFTVQYGGAEATATMDVTGTTVVLYAPAATVVATIDLTTFATIQDLVDRIALVAGFTASVSDGNYTKPALNGLDYVSAQNVKTAPYVARADLQAAVDWLNNGKQGFVDAVRVASVGTLPAVSAFAFLSGGSDGTTTNTDWADAFEALQGIDAQWITPVSGDDSIHAMADTHVAFMSTVGRKERRAIVGTASGTTDAIAITKAKALNSDRTSLVHIGHYDYDLAGKLALLPPYISAARIAGGFAGVNPGTPLTNKNFKCRGLERELRNPIDTDPLINGGVLCIESTEQGYKVVQSISTWLINDNYNRVEQSCGVAVDFVARNIRQALDVLRGAKGNPLVLSRAVSITESTLRELAREEPQGPGVIVGNAASPAYRNIKASLEGDVLRVEFECSPVIPVNYVLATIFAVPFSGTATTV
jgi:hypothetical protein